MYQESVKDVLLYVKPYSGKISRLKSFLRPASIRQKRTVFVFRASWRSKVVVNDIMHFMFILGKNVNLEYKVFVSATIATHPLLYSHFKFFRHQGLLDEANKNCRPKPTHNVICQNGLKPNSQ